MIGLIRRLFMWGFVALLIWVILQLEYQGKPVKRYVQEFLDAPLIQEIGRQAKGLAKGYLQKDLKESGPPLEEMSDEDREALEKVLKEEAEKK